MAEDPMIGSRIREYEIIDILGKGGMGAVYRARHVYLDEDRAIKVIQGRLAGDTDFVERFIREAKILTKLRHPNLVQLFEFGTLEQDTFFMVMELIQGESVINRIKRAGSISIIDTIRIIRQAALGLNSAHLRGIIHRDISPDNLILLKDENKNEITKVIDFGIAKPLFESGSQHFTATNFFIGKPEYCSPEQCGVMEDAEIIDARSDIYSLGVTMYHMLAGRLPFLSKTPQGYLLKHASEVPKPVSSVLQMKNFPAELDRVLLKMLEKKREDRYPSMEDFIKDLDNTLPPEYGGMFEFTAPVNVSLSASELRPGELFSRRYLIERKLGQGGMGTVYKAVDRILEVPVALKIMNTNIVQDEKTVERFKREVILARKVAHPNACRIFDMGESAGIHYVSMEYLEGNTLSEMIREQGKLAPPAGLMLLKQVLLALQEAHRVGIVHRDLKPQNIMVDTNMKAHIMDFGISISSEMHRVTQTGAIIGTPFYMAPEQFEGGKTDLRADIYSMGVIMFEVFTGRLPFQGETPIAVIFAHLKSEPPTPSQLNPSIPPELDRIILKALNKDVEGRYQSVRELLRDIEPLVDPGTTLGALSREQIAHKLIAEQSYSKAIKFLSHLLKNDPGNTSWKKLHNIAASGKITRDIRRARHLIHKKNLIHAQLLVERIKRLQPESTKVTKQIKKLESWLSQERDRAIETYLVDAKKSIELKNWPSVFASLEAAWNLKTNDPRITELQDQAQSLQQHEYEATLNTQLNEAKSVLDRGDAQTALGLVDEVLKESPTYAPAMTLQSQITELIRVKTEEEKLRKRLTSAMQPFLRKDFEQASLLFEMLTNETSENFFKTELQRIHSSVKAIAVGSRQQNLETMSDTLKTLLEKDPVGWLEPFHKDLKKIRQEIEAEIEVARKFRSKFEEAKKAYDEGLWDDAIAAWEVALKIQPHDALTMELLAAAKKQRQIEMRVIKKLETDLESSENLLKQKKYDEARSLLDVAEQSLTLGYRTEGFLEKIDTIRKKLDVEKGKEQAHRDAVQKELSEISGMLDRKEFETALIRVDTLLKQEPGLKAAQQLKARIQEGLEDVQKESNRLKNAQNELGEIHKVFRKKEFNKALEQVNALLVQYPSFQEALAFRDVVREAFRTSELEAIQNLFDQMEWEKAIERCETSLDVLSSDPQLLEKQAEAKSLLMNEGRIREQLSSDLSDAEQLVSQKKFREAEHLLQRMQKSFAGIRSSELHQQAKTLRQKVQEGLLSENARLTSIKQELLEAQKLFKAKDLQGASQKVNAILQNEPGLTEALQLRESIQRGLLDQERLVASFQAVFNKGESYFQEYKWEEAIASFRKAYSIIADPGVNQWIDAAEERLRTQKQIRADLSAKISACENLIEVKKFQEAKELLDSLPSLLSPHYFLSDIKNDISSLQSLWKEEFERDSASRKAAENLLAEVRKMFERESYEQALVRVEALLHQSPDLDPAIQLRAKIKAALQEKRRIEFQQLLQEALRQFQTKHWDSSLAYFEKLNELNSAHPQVREYLPLVRERADQLAKISARLKSTSQALEKQIAAARYDEAIQISSSILKEDFNDFLVGSELTIIKDRQNYAFAARSKSTLDAAAEALQAGDLQKADRLFKKVLEWEPGNATAVLGVKQLEAIHTQKQSGIAPVAIPTPKLKWWWIAAPLVLILVIAIIWYTTTGGPKPPDGPPPVTRLTEAAVTINALPWARVKVIPASKDTKMPAIPDEELVTPCLLTLPFGEYTLELDNGTSKLTEQITVSESSQKEYNYILGDFDPEQVVEKIGGGK